MQELPPCTHRALPQLAQGPPGREGGGEVRGLECNLSSRTQSSADICRDGQVCAPRRQASRALPQRWFGRLQGITVQDRSHTWIPQELVGSCGAKQPRRCWLVTAQKGILFPCGWPRREPRTGALGSRRSLWRIAPVLELRHEAIGLPGLLFHTTRGF